MILDYNKTKNGLVVMASPFYIINYLVFQCLCNLYSEGVARCASNYSWLCGYSSLYPRQPLRIIIFKILLYYYKCKCKLLFNHEHFMNFILNMKTLQSKVNVF